MARPSLRQFAFGVTVAVVATLPALAVRLAGLHPPPLVTLAVFGLSILGAGFLLSWGAEAAEAHVAQGVALAGLALVTVLPEYAVDIYYTLRAGADPGSDYVQFAAANMTGANRLLIGVGWPLIALLYWVARGVRSFPSSEPTRWRSRSLPWPACTPSSSSGRTHRLR
jgi:cation:H+ antiporter